MNHHYDPTLPAPGGSGNGHDEVIDADNSRSFKTTFGPEVKQNSSVEVLRSFAQHDQRLFTACGVIQSFLAIA
jgi:hypothetical protein